MQLYQILGITTLVVMIISAQLYLYVLYQISKKKRTPFDILLAHTYINSLFIIVVIIGFQIVVYCTSWEYMSPAAPYLLTSLILAYENQVIFQLFKVFQAYVAIMHPLQFKSWITNRRTKLGLLAIYCFTSCIYVAIMVCIRLTKLNLDNLSYGTSLAISIKFLIAMLVFVRLSLNFITKHFKTRKNSESAHDKVRAEKYKKAYIVMTLQITLKVVSYTPSILYYVRIPLFPQSVVFLMMYLDQVVSPIIYIQFYRKSSNLI